MGKSYFRNKFGIYGFAICSVGIILVQLHYAGIVSNLWYIINLLFWSIVGTLNIRYERTKNDKKWIAVFFLGLAFALVFFLKLPSYSPDEAKKVILEEHTELVDSIVRRAGEYKGYMERPMYLIVFETEPLTAFWFDADTGNYGRYDIEKRLPFIR